MRGRWTTATRVLLTTALFRNPRRRTHTKIPRGGSTTPTRSWLGCGARTARRRLRASKSRGWRTLEWGGTNSQNPPATRRSSTTGRPRRRRATAATSTRTSRRSRASRWLRRRSLRTWPPRGRGPSRRKRGRRRRICSASCVLCSSRGCRCCRPRAHSARCRSGGHASWTTTTTSSSQTKTRRSSAGAPRPTVPSPRRLRSFRVLILSLYRISKAPRPTPPREFAPPRSLSSPTASRKTSPGPPSVKRSTTGRVRWKR
mmetsp:Transcript_18327/g.63083  ORF Transcript_18327/g.63083 Transcript_18327/m.63083 type:complete len:258 (+) Transcript_18327:462-1235(+)